MLIRIIIIKISNQKPCFLANTEFLLQTVCKLAIQISKFTPSQGKPPFLKVFNYICVTVESYRMGEVQSNFSPSTPISSATISNAGHRFLQPRVNSGSSVRRVFSPGSVPATVTSANPVSSSGPSFTYQSVAIGMDTSGVTVPVQRIIEGLPVVTLPGIVTHEVKCF